MRKYTIAAAALFATLGVARAQQDIEWKQIINVPKGEHIPRERADILGIELGDNYTEAKAKLGKLAEGAPVNETKRIFRVQVPGASTVVTASYVGRAEMERVTQGKSGRNIKDKVTVFFSAPSSGQQVIGIARAVDYFGESDQPRVSEVLGMIDAKMKIEPQKTPKSGSADYLYLFKSGQPYVPKAPRRFSCNWYVSAETAAIVPQINAEGDCEAGLLVSVHHGISTDHAKSVNFNLYDNERVKLTGGADYKYIGLYIRDLQELTRGAPPKL